MIPLFDFVQKVQAGSNHIAPIGDPDAVITDVPGAIDNVGQGIVSLLLLLAGVFAVAFIMYGGLLYISAGGDGEKTKKAKGTIINGAIGVVLITCTFAIIRFAGIIGNTIAEVIR